VASAGSDKTIRLWSVDDGEPNRVLSGHTGTVYRIAYNDKGDRMVSASSDLSVGVWNIDTGKRLATLDDHNARVRDARYRSDGRILSAGDDRRVLFGDAKATERAALQHSQRVQSVDSQPNGELIVTGSADGNIRLWGASSNAEHVLEGHEGTVFLTRFSPDGTLVASAGEDGTVRLWNVESGRPAWHAPLFLGASASLLTQSGWIGVKDDSTAAPAFSPSLDSTLRKETHFATARDDMLCVWTYQSEVQLWRVSTGTMESKSASPGLKSVRATDDGCLFLADGQVSHLRPKGRSDVLQFDGRARAIDVGKDLLVATDKEVISYKADGTAHRRAAIDGGVTALTQVDADSFAVGYRDGNIAIAAVGATKGRQVASLERLPSSAPTRMLAGPSGTLLVTFSNGAVGMWNLADGSRLAVAQLHGPVVHAELVGGFFYAATELGDALHWDLGAFRRDHCALLNELWSESPVVWKTGQLVNEPPPDEHPCR
jgi:WD40 repeat protein